MTLEGRVAIVTGASRGIGADIARYLAKHGASVALAARSVDTSNDERMPGTMREVEESIKQAGGNAISVRTNMRYGEEIEALVARTVEEFGRVDIVVNNAVVVTPGRLETLPERYLDLMWQVSLRGPLQLIQQAIPHMRTAGGGDIINISSGAARFPGPGPYEKTPQGPGGADLMYGAVKSALDRATQGLAVELQDDHIKANALSPGGLIRTPGTVFARRLDVPEEGYEAADWMGRMAVWICDQPPTYTGHILFDSDMRDQIAHL